MSVQQQQHYQAGMLPVTSKFAQLSPDEFRTSLSETWQASKAILDMVADQVEGTLITPVQGAQVASAITGTLVRLHRVPSGADAGGSGVAELAAARERVVTVDGRRGRVVLGGSPPPTVANVRDPSLDHIQITTSLGQLTRHGFVWTHGDRFRYRTWLGLRLLDPEAARLYFETTRSG